jgi:hypothetical protein
VTTSEGLPDTLEAAMQAQIDAHNVGDVTGEMRAIERVLAFVGPLCREVEKLHAQVAAHEAIGNPPMPAWSCDNHADTPLPEDIQIQHADPTVSGRHDLYAEAMRLVGARRSKAGLVSLVNWLLHEIQLTNKMLKTD